MLVKIYIFRKLSNPNLRNLCSFSHIPQIELSNDYFLIKNGEKTEGSCRFNQALTNDGSTRNFKPIQSKKRNRNET